MPLKASIAIPTYKRGQMLLDALYSVLEQNCDFAYEVLVLDNACNPELHTTISDIADKSEIPIKYFEVEKIGLHEGRHRAAKEAKGDIVVYIDDDIIAHPDWLRCIVDPFSDSDVAMVGGKVLPKWEGKKPDFLDQFNKGCLSLLDLGDERMEGSYIDVAYGCNMAVRKSVVFEVGGFNPDSIGKKKLIWMRGDGETGFAKKVIDAGYKTIWEPDAWLYHRIPESRTTAEYFEWRLFIQGISDSYSQIREDASRRHLARRGIKYLGYYGKEKLLSKILKERRIYRKSQAKYWYGMGIHHFMALLKPELLAHIQKKHYY